MFSYIIIYYLAFHFHIHLQSHLLLFLQNLSFFKNYLSSTFIVIFAKRSSLSVISDFSSALTFFPPIPYHIISMSSEFISSFTSTVNYLLPTKNTTHTYNDNNYERFYSSHLIFLANDIKIFLLIFS